MSEAKPKTLKVYGGCLDGKNRVIVAARSKTEAGRLLKCSPYSMKELVCETGTPHELKQALSEPGVVFVRSVNGFGGSVPWERKDA
jgi:hypothetical protein